MKEKILAAIKAKSPTAKLSAKRLDALAATIEAKAGTDETLIDSALDALNEIYPLTEIAKDDHIRSTLEGKLKATQSPKKEETPVTDTETPDVSTDTETQKLLKALLEQNKKLSESVAAIQGEKVKTTYQQKADVDLKDIPASFRKISTVPTTDEEYEAYKETMKTAYAEHLQELTDKGLSVIPPPGGGHKAAADSKNKASDKEVEDIVKNIM